MRNFIYILLLCLNCIVFSQEKPIKIIKPPKDYTSELDVIYTTVGNWKGRMDLYTNPIVKEPTPIVINIHGGGWVNGSKDTHGGFNFLFKKGFAVANINYRLRGIAKAPAAIEDVRCALIYVHEHAKALNIDPNKIVIMGGSAGGHLVLMAGLLGSNNDFDTNCNYKSEIKVAAIINRYGVADMNILKTKGSVRKWIGTKIDDEEFIKSISPINYINKKSPPTFIIHGNKDLSVPYVQSVLLYDKFKEYNVKSEFMTVEGGGHGKFSREERKKYQNKIYQFLKELNIIN